MTETAERWRETDTGKQRDTELRSGGRAVIVPERCVCVCRVEAVLSLEIWMCCAETCLAGGTPQGKASRDKNLLPGLSFVSMLVLTDILEPHHTLRHTLNGLRRAI